MDISRFAPSGVGSRAWGSTKGLSLIPFADFLNHDGASESVVLSDEAKCVSEVIADRDYVPGEEVFIQYGKFPNSTLLVDFGFTVPYNIYDQVNFQLDAPCDDPLRAMKLELMQRHSILKIKDASFNCTGGSFLIKEVRSVKGKGKGIPQSLRAFARILCCASPEELNDLELKATQTDGRLARCPLTKGNREMQAHKILLSHIIEVIEKYDASIKSLSYMSKPQEDADKFIHRRKMAEYLLSGEVRVLRSASAWLHNYCSALKKGIMF